MKRKLVLFLSLLVLLSSLLYVRFSVVMVNASNGYPVHNINTGLNYTAIQKAIDASETLDGHTILVDAGFYDEYVDITKSLTIIGENKSTTIVDGRIFVWANYSCVAQFTVQNGGIHIENPHGSTISNNILKNNYIGIAIYESSGNMLRNNTMLNNTYNFDINGWFPSDFFQNIDSSNTVDGKPIYYLVNQHNQQIPDDAGYVALVNSTKIMVKNLSLKNNGMGILLINCTYCTVENVTSNDMDGIDMRFSSNNTITNNTFVSSNYGFFIMNSDRNSMTYNRIHTDYGDGVWLQSSEYNVLSFNILSGFVGDGYFNGIWLLDGSNSNIITGNTISSYYRGVLLLGSYNNTIYHNNFVVAHNQVCSNNFLEEDKEGNYYSTYVGVDLDKDGIGDSQYVVYEAIDNYPLMGIFSSFNTSLGHHVNVISNSTIEDFEYFESNSTIQMYVSNMTANQTYGFCRICIPHTLMNVTNISVIIDDGITSVLHQNFTLYDNGTHRWIYFAYEHSIHKVDIIPESPSFFILPLIMIATLLAVIVYRRKCISIT